MSTEFEFNVKGMAELKRDLDQVKAMLGGVGQAHAGVGAAAVTSGAQTESFSASMSRVALPVGVAVAAITGAFAATKKFGNELERQTGILLAFEGSIDEAAKRTSGLFTQLNLVSAWNRASQAGIRLSAKSFADLAVAADEFAGATGTDGVQALDQLTQALSQGSTRAFKQLGIEVDTSKSKLEQQQQIVAEISAKFGTLSADVDTAAGMFEVLANKIDDAETEFIAGFGAVDTLRGGFTDLGTEVRAFAEAIGLASGTGGDGGLSVFTQAGITAATMLDGLMRRFAAFVRGIQQASTGDFANASREMGTAFGSMDTEIGAGGRAMNAARAAASARAGAASVATDQFRGGGVDRPRGGGGSSRSGRVDDGGFMGPGSETLADLDAEESTYQSSLGLAETNKSAETIAGRADLLNEQMALARAKDEEALTIQREAQADALARQNEELSSQQELLKGIGSNMMALGVGIFEQGPKKAFKAWAKQFAIQQGGLAIEALAMAAPLLLTPGGQVTGGAYVERAALHGAAAAAVGAAGAATGGGSRRGGGGGGARPEQPSSMAGQSGPAVPNQITVHINSPVAESELGRMNARAAQEAERRFGR